MVNYLLTKGSITLQYDGKTKLIAKDDQRFEQVIAAIREGKMDQVPEIVEPELYLKKQGLDVEDGLVLVNGEAMPPELNSRIMEYKSQNLPFKSLLRFWENLRQNPSFNSRMQLFKFLENQGHSITEDGCFVGYRGVSDDLKDKHSGKFDNSPGKICEMPREQVDDNPNNTCSHGLHVGGFEYAKSFGPKLVLVKVNPKDVVAVPNDYNGQKMRVCRFEVLKLADAIVTDTVVSDDGSEYDYEEEDFFEDEDDVEDFDNSFDDNEDLDGLDDLGKAIHADPPKVDKKRYANNHNKRDKSGKFAPKKKSAKKVAKKARKKK